MPAAESRSANFVRSLDRGLSVIRSFSRERPALTLSDVAARTGLTRAAARRFLLTLRELGYVSNDGRLFRLRPKVLELGHAYVSALTVPAIAQPHLEDLAQSMGVSASVSVLDGDDIVYVGRASVDTAVTGLAIGSRLPAYATSMGRALLAGLPPDDLDAYLAESPRPAFTARTVTDSATLRAELSEVRDRGYALVDQELETGVRSAAVALCDGAATPIAAINAGTRASHVTMDQLRDRVVPVLIAKARAIERDLDQANNAENSP